MKPVIIIAIAVVCSVVAVFGVLTALQEIAYRQFQENYERDQMLIVNAMDRCNSLTVEYNSSINQDYEKGFQFGNEIAQIQQDVAELQTKFYSEKIKLDEGDITKDELLEYYKQHIDEFQKIILRYEQLDTPELFESAVGLFKSSSEIQLKSDIEYAKWISTGEELVKERSDTYLQKAYEYETSAFDEWDLAKTAPLDYTNPTMICSLELFSEVENFCEKYPYSDILEGNCAEVKQLRINLENQLSKFSP